MLINAYDKLLLWQVKFDFYIIIVFIPYICIQLVRRELIIHVNLFLQKIYIHFKGDNTIKVYVHITQASWLHIINTVKIYEFIVTLNYVNNTSQLKINKSFQYLRIIITIKCGVWAFKALIWKSATGILYIRRMVDVINK